jgi:hypothetical protein
MRDEVGRMKAESGRWQVAGEKSEVIRKVETKNGARKLLKRIIALKEEGAT